MRKYFSFMYELTKGHRLKYLYILVILLITTILTLLSSYVTKIVVDCFSYTNGVADIFVPNKSGPIGTLLIAILGGPEFINNNKWILAIAIMLFGFFLATSNIVKGLLRASIESKISAGLRNKLFDHIQRLPYEFLKKQNKGDLLQTCTRDESVLREFV